jgi:hypothetical protein
VTRNCTLRYDLDPLIVQIESEHPMLARPETYRCIECGLPYQAAGFQYYHGELEKGPAYWTDRGLLCSAQCSLAHYTKRKAEGTLPQEPAPDPFEVQFRR